MVHAKRVHRKDLKDDIPILSVSSKTFMLPETARR